MMNTVHTKFSSANVWFTEPVNEVFDIEDTVNLMLVIGYIL